MFCIDLQWMIIFIQFNIVTEDRQVKKNELKLIIIFLCIYQLYLHSYYLLCIVEFFM